MRPDRNISTPWGIADSARTLAPGIVLFNTPSHGGFWLDATARAAMPEQYRTFQTFAGGNWYEEDLDWALVALSFPQLFDAKDVNAARQTYDSSYQRYFAKRHGESNV